MSQITKHIMMIEPVSFRFNEETAENNYYQKVIDGLSPEGTQEKALSEFTKFVDKLRFARCKRYCCKRHRVAGYTRLDFSKQLGILSQ